MAKRFTKPPTRLICVHVWPAFVERQITEISGQDTGATSGRQAVAAKSVWRAPGDMASAITTRVESGSTMLKAVHVSPASVVWYTRRPATNALDPTIGSTTIGGYGARISVGGMTVCEENCAPPSVES